MDAPDSARHRSTPLPARVRFPATLYTSAAYAPRHARGGLLVRPYVMQPRPADSAEQAAR